MRWFLWDEFDIRIPECTISRRLEREDFPKKGIRCLAAKQNSFFATIGFADSLIGSTTGRSLLMTLLRMSAQRIGSMGGHLLVSVPMSTVLINDRKGDLFFQHILAVVDIFSMR